VARQTELCFFANQLSRKLLSALDRLGCLSFRIALASICRIRSRVTENCWPTSSSVWSLSCKRHGGLHNQPDYVSPKNKFQTRWSAFHPTDPAFEPSLHQHRFPLSGNAILRGRDKGPEKALEIQPIDCRETNGCTNTRRFGAFRTELGNLRSTANAWWGRKDSNFQPNDYQP
jgi:hypothetical protein